MESLHDPGQGSERQQPGLQESINRLMTVIKYETVFVSCENIFLAGFDQGFAVAAAAFVAYSMEDFCGLFGFGG